MPLFSNGYFHRLPAGKILRIIALAIMYAAITLHSGFRVEDRILQESSYMAICLFKTGWDILRYFFDCCFVFHVNLMLCLCLYCVYVFIISSNIFFIKNC